MKKTFSIILLFFIATSNLFSQFVAGEKLTPTATLTSGDISSLNAINVVNIVYTYTNLKVGEFNKEEDYLNKRCNDYKEKGKDSSLCGIFRQRWVDGRKDTYEPRFELLFNKYGKSLDLTGTNYTNTNNITLEVNTVFVEVGYNIGLSQRPSRIDLECTFKDKTGKILCVFFVKNATGSTSFDFNDVRVPIGECYAKAAKLLTSEIKNERKKKLN